MTGLIPAQRNATVMQEGISWNYTTWLNIAFLILAAALVLRFARTGGIAMLRMMGGAPDTPAEHNHSHHAGQATPTERDVASSTDEHTTHDQQHP